MSKQEIVFYCKVADILFDASKRQGGGVEFARIKVIVGHLL